MSEQLGPDIRNVMKQKPTLLERGITSIPELQEHARNHGGDVFSVEEVRPLLSEDMQPILRGVEHVLVDATGNVGYQNAKQK